MKNLLLTISLIAFLCSCNSNEESITPNDTTLEYTIATAVDASNNFTLALQSTKESLSEGVNTVAFVLKDSSIIEPNGQWKITPIMTMMHGEMYHMHSTPTLGFDEQTTGGSGIGQILFMMPTVEMGNWKLEVSYTKDDTEIATWEMEITVNAVEFLTNDAAFKTVINTGYGEGDESLILGYNFLEGQPSMGSNAYEILAFKRMPSHDHMSLETYIPLNNLEIVVTPWMPSPSMNHGSSNNTDPVFISEGKYEGIANFTMTGGWQLKLNIEEEGNTILDEEGQTFYFEF